MHAGLVMQVLLYILTGQFLELFSSTKEIDVMDAEEAAFADLEVPLVNGSHAAAADGHMLPPAAMGATVPIAAAAAAYQPQEAIPIGSVRRSSYTAQGTPMGSYRGRGTPYERGSFTMYINTFGSQTSPAARGLLGSVTQPCSEDPEH
jgi:hypothetical protein